MKLYTEEQLKQIFVTHYFITDKELEDLRPIELRSDEEIEQHIEKSNSSLEFDTGFKYGAKWMRDKIKGNNDQY